MLLPKITALLSALALVSAYGADIEGVVTFNRVPDSYFFLQTASGEVWRVQRDANDPRVSIGDVVSAGGHYIKGVATPRFKADVVRMLGRDPSRLPKPERVPLGELLVDPIADTNAVNRYGRIVTTQGVVRDVNRRQTFMQLSVGSEAGIIQTVIPYAFARPTPEDLRIGASVRVTGVYVYGSMQDQGSGAWTGIETPSILAAKETDLVVVSAAPFWTPGRFWMLIGAILFAAGALVFWVKSREKAKADAVQRERLRLSRDLHDGFQQLLAGSMFRPEAAMNLLPEDATEARVQLEKVSDSLYHTQTGLRAALWSMTEESEGPQNLSGLVKYAAGRLAHWQGVVNFEFRGEERHVPRALTGEILMGLQEAVGNALRHGGATDVKVVFSFRRDGLVILVRDNGCGFNPATVEGTGHLGLRSMRERAERHGGTMKITSEIGAGTVVVVRLPYSSQNERSKLKQ